MSTTSTATILLAADFDQHFHVFVNSAFVFNRIDCKIGSNMSKSHFDNFFAFNLSPRCYSAHSLKLKVVIGYLTRTIPYAYMSLNGL